MMRAWGIALFGAAALGCSTVKVAERDGCWVRRTHSFLSSVKEEVGVCTRAPPVWSKDRVTRLVQECMAEADYRWRNEALAAWNQGKPLPPEKTEHEVMRQCMNDSATALVRENESLQKRVADLSHQRDALRAQSAQSVQDLRENQARMTQALGEAAKRPTPNAYALATSSGTADTQSAQQPASPVVVPTLVPWPTPGAPEAPKHHAKAKVAEKPHDPAPAPKICAVPPGPSSGANAEHAGALPLAPASADRTKP